MEINTVFGIKWPVPSGFEYVLILIIVLLAVVIASLIRYRIYLKDKRIHDYQFFLFKMKRLGLSNFQIKIINNMAEFLRLSNPSEMLDKSDQFEQALGRFLVFLRDKGEKEESLAGICKDITIIYEKLYFNELFKKPLERIQDIGLEQLLYFVTDSGDVYLGKIVLKQEDYLFILLFRPVREIQKLSVGEDVIVFIWRVGDAEYKFTSQIGGIDFKTVKIGIPETFIRDKEFRHPYLDVIIPAAISKADLKPLEEPVQFTGTVLKMNDYELVVRMTRRLDYRFKYMVEFELMDFKFNTNCLIIANKTVEEESLYYYTFKFTEMSEGARHVLKTYIYEHL